MICLNTRRRLAAGRVLSGAMERHLFVCARCQRRSRAEAALQRLADLGSAPPAPSAAFVGAVMRRVRASAAAPEARFPLAAAAALLAFAFLAGLAFSLARDAGRRIAEEATLTLSPAEPSVTPFGF